MQKIKRTTVVLTKKAQQIKDKYVTLGLRGMLSVGLEMFNALSDTDKILRVSQVIAEDEAEKIVDASEVAAAKPRRKRGRPSAKVSE